MTFSIKKKKREQIYSTECFDSHPRIIVTRLSLLSLQDFVLFNCRRLVLSSVSRGLASNSAVIASGIHLFINRHYNSHWPL